MKRFSLLISRYLVQAILPYFIFSWLLLTVILFAQQASRFSDIFFSVNIPSNLVWQLTLALIPNVVAFTCPMALLVGTIIGLAKMQGDSELVAIRAAGVGNLQITVPIFILGLLLSLFAFFVNLKGVPLAAQMVRQVALKTAIQKLESPIEPGVFNTEVAGYTIYVKGGDATTGTWKNIFIYNEDAVNGLTRLITSTNGRIDVTGDASELVLENATVSSFPRELGQGKFISENIGQVRIAIQTKRGELIQKLTSAQGTPEELGLSELADYAASREGKDRVEAQLLWQRRIILSLTPLMFCLVGTAMMLRFHRGGRGFGIFLALVTLVVYYLLAFFGEQLARTGSISVWEAGLIPIALTIVAILWFNLSGRINIGARLWERIAAAFRNIRPTSDNDKGGRANLFVDLTTGLRDFDIVYNIVRYFLLAFSFVGVLFLIFTAFELWKFAGAIDGGINLLLKYLFFLLPFMYIQLAPSAAMIAILTTYVIKSRQNEIVVWTSSGQSVYRLLMPAFVLMLALGFANWEVQERILPHSNQVQDQLRMQIRNRGVLANQSGKLWVADDQRIYSFEPSVGTANSFVDGETVPAYRNASDNDQAPSSICPSPCVSNLAIYEFGADKAKLQAVYRSKMAGWDGNRILFIGKVERTEVGEGKSRTSISEGGELPVDTNPFAELKQKPSHMDTVEVRDQISRSESELERLSFQVALHKKYSTLLLPLIIALFTAPFALSLSRKGKAVTVGYAVGLWLLFTGITNVFEQFGLNASLPPAIAVWAPLAAFALLGVYLLTKVRT